MLDLRQARAKIDRAKKHIRDLDAECVSFLGTDPYVGVPKYDPESDRTHFFIEDVPDVPVVIPVILGDAVHNLRTALDYLASEIVRDATLGDAKNVYFPIAETVEKYESESPRKTPGMPPSAKQIIDTIRPYGGGNYYLWGLHQLDINDKHKLLATVGKSIASWQFGLSTSATEITFASPSILEKGDVIGWVSGNHETDKHMSVTASIALREPEVFEDLPMVDTLTQLTNLVEAIILYFETHYPPPAP